VTAEDQNLYRFSPAGWRQPTPVVMR